MKDLNLGRGMTAVIGLVAAFLIAVIVNAVASKLGGARVDLTENNIHTLSKGTRSILNKLESPVKLRYYVTDSSDIMSPSERQSAQRIEQKLDEFVRAAPVKKVEIANPETGEFETQKIRMLTVEKLNPEPNTDAEDSATLDGMQPVVSMENNEMYMGIAIKCVDEMEQLPYIGPQDEDTLEYKLISAISSVHGGSDIMVRVMTSLPVAGGMGASFQAPPNPKWAFYGLTEQKFKIETLAPTVKEIPDDTACLLVLHPYDINDDGQFAIDQYLLKGGNVIAMVDPNFFYARSMGGGQPQMPGAPPAQGPPPTSDLKKLFAAWGVKYDDTQVLADIEYGSEIIRPGNFSPTFLTLNDKSMDGVKEDIVTNMLNHLNMLTPGAFDITQKEGVSVDYLVQSSTQCQFVSSFDADPTQDGGAARIRENFKAADRRMPLVARLRGNFKTAFPEGDPSAPKEEEKKPDAEAAAEEDGKGEEDKIEEDVVEKIDDSLKESVKAGSVVLFGDVDFIFDPIVIQRRQIAGLGIEMVQPLNENLTLLENAIAQSSGDPDLIHVRSRAEVRRPFTRQNEWRKVAEDKFRTELESFNQKKKDTEATLTQLLSQQPEGVDADIINEQMADQITNLRKESALFSQKARELQKEMTKEFKRKQTKIKFANTAILPVIVILTGIGLAVFRKTRTAAR